MGKSRYVDREGCQRSVPPLALSGEEEKAGHTCGGVSQPHIRERMRELLDAGYAVLALDTFGPRGISQCRNQTMIRSSATVMDEQANA